MSVIISNYNAERFIEAAVGSVLTQTHVHLEVIVCDDGSTDGSASVLKRLAASDCRIRLLFKENGGQASAWNAAFDAASGDILCFVDPDDLFHKDKLQEVVAAFASHPNAGLCYHRLQPLDGSLRPSPPMPRKLDGGWLGERATQRGLWGNWPATSGIAIRQQVADVLFPIPAYLRQGYCDSYIAGAGQLITEVVSLERPLGVYRLHGGNTVSARRPSVETLDLNIRYHRLLADAWRSFLLRRFGDDFTARVNLASQRIWYWENLLALHLLSGKPEDGVQGHPTSEILSHADSMVRKILWRILVAMPLPLVMWLLDRWWGTHRWKYAIRVIAWRGRSLRGRVSSRMDSSRRQVANG